MKRDLISLQDFSREDLTEILASAQELKANAKKPSDQLYGKSIGLLFQKPSNRTRVSFEVGIWQMGGNCIYLGPSEIDLGKRESTSDVAQTLSRYLDGIVTRTFHHQDVIDLGKYADVPVINGLSDFFHPCQALADIFTIGENFNNLKGLTLAYIGDGNNVCHSLLLGCAMMGINMSVATPKGYGPDINIMNTAATLAHKSDAKIELAHSPQEAVDDANVIYADVWTSMGQEEERQKRLKNFKGYQINADLAKLADEEYIFMHCLPAHRGEEVTEDVIDGPHSIVFNQAENRMHVQKAILTFLLG